MSETTPQSEHLHIRSGTDGNRQFVLHPDDNDVFVRTGKQIIEGCRLSISIAVWLEELKEMFAQVHAWCMQRPDRVESCLAVARGSKVIVFFVPPGSQFNFDLADELAELNRELVTTLNIGMVEIGQIPRTEVDRFLDLDTAKLVYGKPIETPRPVEA